MKQERHIAGVSGHLEQSMLTEFRIFLALCNDILPLFT